MTQQFDLVVIGTGVAGAPVATACRQAGWEVALVDDHPYGGTCALRGCDPKKVLVGAADAVDWARRMAGKGIEPGGVRIDWPALIRFKDSFTTPRPVARRAGFEQAGIACFDGHARFVGPTKLQVGDEELESRHIVIATGAKPMRLGIDGEEHITISDDFFDLAVLPERVLFIGGGYISLEFAGVAAAAGAQVTVLHRSGHLLRGFDEDLADQLTAYLRSQGLDIQLDTAVSGISEQGGVLAVAATTPAGPRTFEADLVVHGAGRVPNVDDMGLEEANVAFDRRGVRVNEYLQSVSNPAVHAAGDAAGSPGPPLTPAGGVDADVVSTNLLKGNHATPNYGVMPTAAFTNPPLASVGLGEGQARAQGLRFSTNYADAARWATATRLAQPCYGYKVLVEEETDRILGAHLLGPHAAEVINVFAVAMQAGMTATALKEMLLAYPTTSSDLYYML